MCPISKEQMEQVARLMATLPDVECESAVLELLQDESLARRAIDWLPEAFGLVLVNHIEQLILPTTFKARDQEGCWVEIPFAAEPIFALALELGTFVYHNGPRDLFRSIAEGSSVVAAVNNALNAGAELKGAKLSSLEMFGLRAEAYAS